MVSRKDSPRNHESQDHNFALKPDPVHNNVLPLFDDGEGSQNFLEMEWETSEFGANFRPGNGDRVSAFGYLIYDCGHPPFRVEIHPPVGLAVHRNRAIRIPDNPAPENIINWAGGPVGQNIYVPGIHTEVFINPHGGEMMDGENGTQLHQPATLVPDPAKPGKTLIKRGNSITDPSPVAGQVFTFNIYLPRSPKAALEAAGVSGLPDIPLYYKVTNTGPDTLPLQVDSVLVHDDADGSFRGRGEWNMWLHSNNALPGSNQHEWKKIINRKISDHKIVTSPSGQQTVIKPLLHDFQGRPWSTGDDVCVPVFVQGDLPDPVQEEPWHPDNVVLTPGAPAISIFDTSLFKPQGIEEFACDYR